MLIFQMAAPMARFGSELHQLIYKAPLRGPIILTHSKHDRANCLWHRLIEGEAAIGCAGATEPKADIGQIQLGKINYHYPAQDFLKKIVNVDAGWAYKNSFLSPEGAHSDFWYEESIYLALSVANFAHST
jgi:hypothetical protein